MSDPPLRIERRDGVATVVLDHPPLNLLDAALIGALDAAGRELEADDAVRVVVFESANPDFFIAHADVTLIQALPEPAGPRATELGFFHRMVERFRRMPKATIGKVEGIARGGGSELLLALDLRFGARGRCLLSQPELALGLIPGGGGSARLPRLLGRGRALEVVLGCEDFDADLAERYGWINRALPAEKIGAFVERLARRIASFPPEAVALAKAAADTATERPLREALLEEWHLFERSAATPAARERMAAFLAAGGQTPGFEAGLDAWIEGR